MTGPVAHFSDSRSVANYAEAAQRLVPGLEALHRMTLILLSERAPPAARMLVLGAGGGMELKVFAENLTDCRFDGVDPSAAMLKLAEDTLGPLLARVTLHEGYIDTAPAGPFDAACCLLTLHFLPPEDRLRTLRAVRQRLKPGAPFVVAHHSFAKNSGGQPSWPQRFAAFAVASGLDAAKAQATCAAISEHLPALSPSEDEALLREAGFSDVTLFYAALSFRGWVCYA